MAILTPYKVNSYRRLCDICGRPRQIEEIRFSEGVAICSLHPGFRTAAQLNRINARTRPIRILPVPQPKPLAPIDTWTAEESQIFNFVLQTAPFDTVDVTASAGAVTGLKSYESYGWALVYLTAILTENKRPLAWLNAARTKAIALGNELLTLQNPTTIVSSISGGFNRQKLIGGGSAHYALDNAIACAALCRLYTATGDPLFLGGARNAAHFLATLHAVNWWSGSNVYYGALPQARVGAAIVTNYYPSGLLGLWALSLVQGLLGDITVGQANALGGVVPARPISEIIAAIRAFWLPFTTIPGEYFAAGISWFNVRPPSDGWATALFSLSEVDGVSGQVSALWDHLMSYTSGPGIPEPYDPSLALATVLNASTVKNDSSFYDWGTAGLLAKITAARNRAAVKRVKDVLAEPRARYATPHSPAGAETLYLGPLGISTLAFAPVTSGTSTRVQSVVRAAKAGLIYRQQPQGFTGRGH